MSANINAVLSELGAQRMLLGDRAAEHAGTIAVLQERCATLAAQNEELRKRLSGLEASAKPLADEKHL